MCGSCGPGVVLAHSPAQSPGSRGLQLVLEHPLPHQVPEQHAEHGVGGQAQEDGPDALVEPQQPLRLAHLQHAVQEAPVQLALLTDWTHTRGGEGGEGWIRAGTDMERMEQVKT